MAPTIRAVGTNSVGTTTSSPGLPSGTVEGDLLVCIIASAGASSEPTMSSDWTKIRTVKNGTASTDSMLTVFYAIQTSGGVSTSVSNGTDHTQARIIGITKDTFDATTPIHVESGGNVQGSTTSVSISGLTTTIDDCLILSISAASLPDSNSSTQYSNWANSSLSSITERTDNNTSTGNGGGQGSASGVKATAGAVGTTTATKASAALLANLMVAIAPPVTEHQIAADLSLGLAVSVDLLLETFIAANLPLSLAIAANLERETFIALAHDLGLSMAVNLVVDAGTTEHFISADLPLDLTVAANLTRETFISAGLPLGLTVDVNLTRETFIAASLDLEIEMAIRFILDMLIAADFPLGMNITVRLVVEGQGGGTHVYRTLLGVG